MRSCMVEVRIEDVLSIVISSRKMSANINAAPSWRRWEMLRHFMVVAPFLEPGSCSREAVAYADGGGEDLAEPAIVSRIETRRSAHRVHRGIDLGTVFFGRTGEQGHFDARHDRPVDDGIGRYDGF